MDWIAVTLQIFGTYFNAKKKIVCWLIWIVGNSFWIAYGLTQQPKMHSIIVLNIFFILMSIYGFSQWRKA